MCFWLVSVADMIVNYTSPSCIKLNLLKQLSDITTPELPVLILATTFCLFNNAFIAIAVFWLHLKSFITIAMHCSPISLIPLIPFTKICTIPSPFDSDPQVTVFICSIFKGGLLHLGLGSPSSNPRFLFPKTHSQKLFLFLV